MTKQYVLGVGYVNELPTEQQIETWINYVQDVVDGEMSCFIPPYHAQISFLQSERKRIQRKLETRDNWKGTDKQIDTVVWEVQALAERLEEVEADLLRYTGYQFAIAKQIVNAKKNINKLRRYAKRLFDIGILECYTIGADGMIDGAWFDGHVLKDMAYFYTYDFKHIPDKPQYIKQHYLGKDILYFRAEPRFGPYVDSVVLNGKTGKDPNFEKKEGKDDGDYSALFEKAMNRRYYLDKMHKENEMLLTAYKDYDIDRVIHLGGDTECTYPRKTTLGV
jgi:hypothetical protein